MSDFSQYGELSPQFKELLAKQPVPPKQDLLELVKTTNDGREKTAAEEMKKIGHQIVMQELQIPARDGYQLEAMSYRARSAPADTRLPLYIHFHGGGFLFGTLSSEHSICARIALGAPVVVLNVNYRHSPDHRYPTAWNDSEDALEWAFANSHLLGSDPQRIIIGGISAGGSLTASLVQTKLKHRTPASDSIAGQVLMIPCVVQYDNYENMRSRLKSKEVSSYVQNENAPILPKARIDFFNSLVFPNPAPTEIRANPGNSLPEDIRGLPPAVFGIAGSDPLRDEGLLYAQYLAENGVPTNVHVFKGLPHGFRRFGDQLSDASKAWDDTMTGGIRWILGKPKAVEKINIQAH